MLHFNIKIADSYNIDQLISHKTTEQKFCHFSSNHNDFVYEWNTPFVDPPSNLTSQIFFLLSDQFKKEQKK